MRLTWIAAILRAGVIAAGLIASQQATAESRLGTILDVGSILGDTAEGVMNTASKIDANKYIEGVTKHGNEILSGVADYVGGRDLGQSWRASIGRAGVGFLTSAGAAELAFAACPETMGVGCVVAAGMVIGAAGKYVTLADWDWYAKWAESPSPKDENKQMNASDGSQLGSDCIQWDEPGRPECGDGSRAPAPGLSPFNGSPGGGQAPAWTTIR